MSIRFIFGASGAGKSHYIYSKVIEESVRGCENGGLSRRRFLIVVPDQFTMQTQKQLSQMHPRGGIMNIDVLSLSRLCHRILEDCGGKPEVILDDTGKSLILKRVAASLSGELPFLGGNLKKQGCLHEVKSAISEFMQYGLSPENVGELADYAKKRGALSQKLLDLQKLYAGFLQYISEHYLTTEEILDRCAGLLKKMDFSDTVVVFDGFTGFTPIQNRFILELNRYAREIWLTVTLGEGEDPYEADGEQKLFYLSKKTVSSLVCVKEREKSQDIFLTAQTGNPGRFSTSPALDALEKNLFRTRQKPYEKEQDSIVLWEMQSRKSEVAEVAREIARLVRIRKLEYRDIAVITGSLEDYAPFVETLFAEADIPFYIDKTRKITLNPMVEYMKSTLCVHLQDFSRQSVLRYLRSGMTGFTMDQADEMENYLTETGICGKSRFRRSFTRKTKRMQEREEPLQKLEEMRKSMMEKLEILDGPDRMSAGEHVRRMYDYLCAVDMQGQLLRMENAFREQQDRLRESEYRQIYDYVMKLLEQIDLLLGDDVISRQEFYEILEAGIDEIKVGTIPQNVDRVPVGDMERTRLSQVRVLFFLGVNEGSIPRSAGNGGIISDMDREFLKDSGMELAPTPRQQMFIQRLYLYLNLTKPSERLYLSYAKTDNAGKSLRPSYLIKTMQRIFRALSVGYPDTEPVLERIWTPKEGMLYLAQELRRYAGGEETELSEGELLGVYGSYEDGPFAGAARALVQACFYRYENSTISKEAARLLYGYLIDSSISRMEKYAACAYSHFLSYGMELKEREEYSFDDTDRGNAFHYVLDGFTRKLSESEYTWFDFPETFSDETIEGLLQEFGMNYGSGILQSSGRKQYEMKRLNRILKRTVGTLQKQMQQGSFQSFAHEMGFRQIYDLQTEQSEEGKIRLHGRIDRVDTSVDEEKVYIKIIDYKSGDQKFDLTALYYGLQLQLVIYMDGAKAVVQGRYPDREAVPGALLYYQVQDPLAEDTESETQIEEQINKALRMEGLVNSDDDIIRRLDRTIQKKSYVIPVEYKADGSFTANSGVMTGEELQKISDYATQKVKQFCTEILNGNIEKNPYVRKQKSSCTYCPYKGMCGFDPKLPGYQRRNLGEISAEEFWSQSQNKQEEGGR